jgi:hypothetical protein
MGGITIQGPIFTKDIENLISPGILEFHEIIRMSTIVGIDTNRSAQRTSTLSILFGLVA